MAAIGTALMSTLSHTDQEKMFRPWWDNLEDFVIYGLISLGLIVLPTQIFQGTPLFCTICTTVRTILTIPRPLTPIRTNIYNQEDQCGANRSSGVDPGYHIYYIKNYCTQDAVR